MRKSRILSGYVALLGILGAFGQPIAGLFHESSVIFLSLYLLRESWIFAAAAILFLLIARTHLSQEVSTRRVFLVATYLVVCVFVLLIGISEPKPSLMIVFLQFRNLFGFAFALVFAYSIRSHLDADLLFRVGLLAAIGVLAYSYLELGLLLKSGYLISDEYFHKTLLEQAKGTRADVGGGLFGVFRIPGPLFNPSQLGIYVVYLIYAGTFGNRKYSVGLILLLVGVVMLGFSKSAFAMLFVMALLRVMGRQVGVFVLLGFMFAPLILNFMSEFLSGYHLASIARHFDGYVSAVRLLAEQPFGTGVGSAGELASTLGGFEAAAGYESGMGTLITNLGIFGILFYVAVGIFSFLQPHRAYFDLFSLWSVSMYFNESAMSPHLFVFQFCIVASAVVSQRSTRQYSERLSSLPRLPTLR